MSAQTDAYDAARAAFVPAYTAYVDAADAVNTEALTLEAQVAAQQVQLDNFKTLWDAYIAAPQDSNDDEFQALEAFRASL